MVWNPVWSPVNFITIFKFQNWLVGQLPGPILAGLSASHYAALLIQEHQPINKK